MDYKLRLNGSSGSDLMAHWGGRGGGEREVIDNLKPTENVSMLNYGASPSMLRPSF